MALKPPTPGLLAIDFGLRRILYDATSPAKLNLVVQPGDELEVSDDVAAQLLRASGQFKDPSASKPTPAPVAEAEEEPPPPPPPPPVNPGQPVGKAKKAAPKKRAAKRSTASK